MSTLRPGIFRRRILLDAPDDSTVEAAVEDDFHHFRLTLRHDGRRIVGCEGAAARYPWSECPGATDVLAGLVGAPLEQSAGALARHTDRHAHCTHLFDLAALASAHALAGRERREYAITVPDRDQEWRTTARLARDGAPVLEWELTGLDIVAPEPFAGVRLWGGFEKWVEERFHGDEAEAVLVLRRACEISMGRATPWDELDRAIEVGDFMLGVCHTFQAGRAEVAVRMKGSIRDFTDRPGDLLAG